MWEQCQENNGKSSDIYQYSIYLIFSTELKAINALNVYAFSIELCLKAIFWAPPSFNALHALCGWIILSILTNRDDERYYYMYDSTWSNYYTVIDVNMLYIAIVWKIMLMFNVHFNRWRVDAIISKYYENCE